MAVLHEGELLAGAGTDAELVDAVVSDEVVDATQDTGVRERIAEIVLAQIGVGVEVDDDDIRVLLLDGSERPERDEMLAAKEERTLAVRNAAG